MGIYDQFKTIIFKDDVYSAALHMGNTIDVMLYPSGSSIGLDDYIVSGSSYEFPSITTGHRHDHPRYELWKCEGCSHVHKVEETLECTHCGHPITEKSRFVLE